MAKEYDIVFITTQPSFYKLNLYNEINKQKKIFVIFISKKSQMRTKDFLKGDKNFDYEYLTEENYEERNIIKNSVKLKKILSNLKYKRIVLGGWDSFENWTAWLISSKKQNAVVVESSEFESTNKGIKGLMKKIYASRISLGFASGESQANLLRSIGYKGEIRKTKGVGIFNYNKANVNRKEITEIKNFVYVGRLSVEKNIEQLIRVFNELPNLNLNIVGYGPLEKELKNISKDNIRFLGKIDNEKLSQLYQENDVFILPSKSEPWGLVVEEALYNGLPVIISNKVGCASEVIVNNVHGLIYNIDLDKELENCILKICDIKKYSVYRDNVKKMDFEKIKKHQVKTYIEENNEI